MKLVSSEKRLVVFDELLANKDFQDWFSSSQFRQVYGPLWNTRQTMLLWLACATNSKLLTRRKVTDDERKALRGDRHHGERYVYKLNTARIKRMLRDCRVTPHDKRETAVHSGHIVVPKTLKPIKRANHVKPVFHFVFFDDGTFHATPARAAQ